MLQFCEVTIKVQRYRCFRGGGLPYDDDDDVHPRPHCPGNRLGGQEEQLADGRKPVQDIEFRLPNRL